MKLEFSFSAREGFESDDIVIDEQIITGRNDLRERTDITVELKGKGFKFADLNLVSVRSLDSNDYSLSVQNVSIKSDKTMIVRVSIYKL
jgi:hypothetical protein